MKSLTVCLPLFVSAVLALGGCASTYSNLVSGSNLGAMEYQPAVLVNPGMDGRYSEVLSICRTVAAKRQVTAAQEAQLKTLTGATASALEGAASGMQFGSMMKQAGLNSSINRDMGIGIASGLIGSLGASFANGSERDAAATKTVLLNCLRSADAGQKYYKVIE